MTEREPATRDSRKLARLEDGVSIPSCNHHPNRVARLDAALGTGGLPLEPSPKFSVRADPARPRWHCKWCAGAQSTEPAQPGIDADRTFDPAYAASLGVALDRLVGGDAESGRGGLEMAAKAGRLASRQPV